MLFELFTLGCILAWFAGAGIVTLGLFKFKPTRKLINKYFDLD